MGKSLVFGKLRDINGHIIQLVDRNNPPLIRSLSPESAISVSGSIEKRSNSLDSAVKDFVVKTVQVLNEAGIVGSQLTTGDTKDWPPEHRYLQLRDTKYQTILRSRAKVMAICRKVLDGLGFLEIETPLLFKSTPEGAREFLVPTRRKNLMYALPQSPQQYKQLLMASGVHKYYQIARCFRDEDLRQDRQPEFTQLDLEMSFANGFDVRIVVDEIVTEIWNELKGGLYTLSSTTIDNGPIVSLTFSEAMAKFGIDKPDLRYDLEIQDVSNFCSSGNSEFAIVEALVLRDFGGNIEPITESRHYKHRIPVIDRVQSNYFRINDQSGLYRFLDLKKGDVVALSTRAKMSYENPTPLGRLRQLVIEQHPNSYLRRKRDGSFIDPEKDFVANWIIDFPLFSPVELGGDNYPIYDFNTYVSTHHPFTMVKEEDYDFLGSNSLLARGQHYDLVINGVEVGGGSTRIHDVELQKYVFESVLKIQNHQELFGHLLRAFECGCPPHAGLAIGFDRMVAMLCGVTIRDVIAFPKTITGTDPVIGSPSKVTGKQLKAYHLA